MKCSFFAVTIACLSCFGLPLQANRLKLRHVSSPLSNSSALPRIAILVAGSVDRYLPRNTIEHLVKSAVHAGFAVDYYAALVGSDVVGLEQRVVGLVSAAGGCVRSFSIESADDTTPVLKSGWRPATARRLTAILPVMEKQQGVDGSAYQRVILVREDAYWSGDPLRLWDMPLNRGYYRACSNGGTPAVIYAFPGHAALSVLTDYASYLGQRVHDMPAENRMLDLGVVHGLELQGLNASDLPVVPAGRAGDFDSACSEPCRVDGCNSPPELARCAVDGALDSAVVNNSRKAFHVANVSKLSKVSGEVMMTDGRGNVLAATPCILPFEYEGEISNTCLGSGYDGRGWCSTGSYNYEDKGEWGACAPGGTTGYSWTSEGIAYLHADSYFQLMESPAAEDAVSTSQLQKFADTQKISSHDMGEHMHLMGLFRAISPVACLDGAVECFSSQQKMLPTEISRLYEVGHLVTWLMWRHDVWHLPSGGTLLGTVRQKGIIPHDDDIDFAYLRDPGEGILLSAAFKSDLLKNGLYISQVHADFYKVTDPNWPNVVVDLFGMIYGSSRVVHPNGHWPDDWWPIHVTAGGGLEAWEFGAGELWAPPPHISKAKLTAQYGPTVFSEVSCKGSSHHCSGVMGQHFDLVGRAQPLGVLKDPL